MTRPAVFFSLPPSWLFSFPPSPEPETLVPYSPKPTFATPINVDPTFFRNTFAPKLPLTFAISYMAFVFSINRLNKNRGYKAWPISKASSFYAFVVLHNTLLALYSGVTCAAMVRALHLACVSPLNPDGLAATVDSLCKMSGPGGYGSAVAYDAVTGRWSSANALVQLSADRSTPNALDRGRVWNEGLGFWGWLFYLSKFYEVMDTLIILAKGKRSSTLQTYHHAGAMLCMWAGMRYMSPPVWMFVLVNSAIHTLMYTYYTLSTLGVSVPRRLKRLLTTMQIMQFVVGASYASVHLFVSYTIPVSVPFKVSNVFASRSRPLSTAASSASASTSSGSSDVLSLLKSFFFAGISHSTSRVPAPTPEANILSKWSMRNQFRPRVGYEQINCIDTTGEAFAIWLNVLYLAPLTALFVRFFVKSYTKGQQSKGRLPAPSRRISTSAVDAARSTTDAIYEGEGEETNGEKELSKIAKKMNGTANGFIVRDGGEAIEEEERGTEEGVEVRVSSKQNGTL